jgi:DNA-binding transcriptional LysR family regulator
MKYNWDDLRIFLTLATESTVAGASTCLKINQSTVLRRIAAMEKDLNLTLFARDKDGYHLTDEGLIVLSTVNAMAECADALEKRIQLHNNSRVAGEVLLSAPDFVVTRLLAPKLEKVLADHPELNIRIRLTNAPLNIAKGEADIVIRVTHKDRQAIPLNLYGRRLGDVRLCPYQAKGRSLENLSWLAWEHADFRDWLAKYSFPDRPIQIISGSPLIHLELIKQANFAAILPCFLGDADAEVERIEGCQEFIGFEAWILTHEDMKHTKRITTVLQYLGDIFTDINA